MNSNRILEYWKLYPQWGTKMYVRWNKCTYFMKRIYIFDNVRIRARWICPYAWRIVRCEFRWWELCICGLFVVCFVGECGVFAGCSLRISLVGVVYLRIVRNVFRWWMWCICGLFIVCFVVWMLHYYNLFAIFWQPICGVLFVYLWFIWIVG